MMMYKFILGEATPLKNKSKLNSFIEGECEYAKRKKEKRTI